MLLLMLCWPPGLARTTSDIDLSVSTKPDIDTLTKILKEICQASVEPAGVELDTKSFETETPMGEEVNTGIRFKFWEYDDRNRLCPINHPRE